jgi:hypothetical protein
LSKGYGNAASADAEEPPGIALGRLDRAGYFASGNN